VLGIYVCLEKKSFYLIERELDKSLAGALIRRRPANRDEWDQFSPRLGRSADGTSVKRRLPGA